ncbi:MAG: glycosyltransferase [Alphaproteobacteria bacterium]
MVETPSPRIAILTPVLDDWDSLSLLLAGLGREPGLGAVERIVVVDDGSATAPDGRRLAAGAAALGRLEIVRLACNLGHQRAIAVGLAHLARTGPGLDAVLVMDADGEDRPADVARLIAAHAARPGRIVLARRGRRPASAGFRLGYAAYRLLYRALTGQTMRFGNFCLLPMAAVRSLVHSPNLWSNLAAAVLRSRLPQELVPIDRGVRYAGRSRMSISSLIVHGVGAIAVYADVALARIVLATVSLIAATAAAMGTVVAVRLLTDYAIPGWASDVMGSLAVMLLLGLVLAGLALFQLMTLRTMRTFVPAADGARFIAEVSTGDHGQRASAAAAS